MNRKNFTLLLFPLFIILGCQKKIDIPDQSERLKAEKINVPPKGFFIENLKVPGVVALTNNATTQRNTTGITTSRQSSSPDPDNGDVPIVLGQQVANPYTVANMQQAVNIFYGGNYPISASHLYVRFKPSSVEQFMTLEETEDLELQDYPMDYDVTQDGDYYQDPNLGTEDFGWLYTVMPVGYNFPSGIQHEIIDFLYLPEDNEMLEDMAESMAGGAQYSSSYQDGRRSITRTDLENDVTLTSDCVCPDPNLECVLPAYCFDPPPGGGGGGGGGNDPRIPRGAIEVQDIRTCNFTATPPINVPVRQARIVCKRWFKIERTYTNDQGQFVSSKKFKNKVKVNLKTKNNNAKVSKIRGIRLWQILFPVKKRLGVFDQGAMASISYLFVRPASANAHDKELPYWVAVTTHNSVVEFRQYSTEFGTGQPPTKLNILVTNWGFQRAAGAAPMWNKCSSLSSDFSSFREYIEFFISLSTYVSQVNLFGFLKNQMDVVIGYAAANSDYNCRLTSANIKSIAYHELGHTAHFAQAGCDYWQAYRTRVANELVFGNPDTRPYGDGTENNAGVVAVGEMWGNHCEFIFSNRQYGNGGANGPFGTGFTARMQFADWQNILGGLNANLNAIENFNPRINQFFGTTVDPHQWIPQGLPYDLMDNRNDFAFNTALPFDNVAGYTAQQCFNALQGDVRTVPAFRDRLLQQNGSNQAAVVTDLFFRYGY